MADEPINAPAQPVEQTQQQTQAPQKVVEDNSDSWKGIVGDKYKTPEELAKAHKELETKLGSQSEEIRKTKEFAEIVNPILEEIRNDPELFDALDKKLRSKDQPDNSQPKDSANDKVDDVRSVASDLILQRFEEKYGITKLPLEEQAALRGNIGDAITRLTGKSFNQVDLRQLSNVLEDAYIIANKDKLINKEALVEATGSIPSIPTSSGTTEETLTSQEARVAEKLGLTRDQYISGKKSK